MAEASWRGQGTDREAAIPLVAMKGIVKTFPGVLANDHIDFELREGEVHALLGENGAGKTTLMNTLYGLYRADEGRIYIHEQPVQIRSPRDAIQLGIGMVHQHFKLVPPHTVTENTILGLDSPRFFLRAPEAEAKIAELSRRYGLQVDPKAKIWQLSMGERQRVEILKILFRDARVLIMDEPTAVLTPREAQELFETLRRMANEGRSTVLITHKLNEAMSVSDRVTVLRKGRIMTVRETAATNKAELARLMVGREVLFEVGRRPANPGSVAVEVQRLQALNDKGLPALKDVSFAVREGEIFGVAGVAGNGQRELAEVIAGLRRAVSGKVLVFGEDVTNRSTKEILERGVAYIPEERLGVACVPTLTVAENLVLRSYRYPPNSKGPFLRDAVIAETAEMLVKEFEILTPSIREPAKHLSGGNLQKLVLARELSGKPRIIAAMHPTRGLDVGATEYVHRSLLAARERGAAVLFVSEDLDEVLALSDHLAIMYGGDVMGIIRPGDVGLDEISLMMAGSSRRPIAT